MSEANLTVAGHGIHEHCLALQTVFPHVSKDLIMKLLTEKQFTYNCLEVVSNLLLNDDLLTDEQSYHANSGSSMTEILIEPGSCKINNNRQETHTSDCEIILTKPLTKWPVHRTKNEIYDGGDVLILDECAQLEYSETVDSMATDENGDGTTHSQYKYDGSFIDLANSPNREDCSCQETDGLSNNTTKVKDASIPLAKIVNLENDCPSTDVELIEKEAKAINIILPQFSTSEIRCALMINLDVGNRFEFTLNELCSKTESISQCNMGNSSTMVNKPNLRDLFAEPTSSSYLEYFDKAAYVLSTENDVIPGCSKANQNCDLSKLPLKLSDSSVSSTSTVPENLHNKTAIVSLEGALESQLSYVLEIIPDAEPQYITQRLSNIINDKEGVDKLVSELLDSKTYPKLTPPKTVPASECIRQKFSDLTLKEFLALFDNENPHDYFYRQKRTITLSYIKNCKNYLKMNYPHISVKNICNILKGCNNLLSPAVEILKEWKSEVLSKKRYFKLGSQLYETDEEFFKEMAYLQLKVEIDHYFLETREARRLEFLEAKLNGSLLECPICCDDELVFSDMLPCELGHIFCKTCVRRHAEEMIGQAKTYFPCLGTDCDGLFSYTVLQELLKPSIFSKLLQKKQAEEIFAANIPDLESCPFCNFATIMPNKEDRLFRCLNPECNRESCRLCKEPNHIPLRCDEVETTDEAKARTTIENHLSEAIIRECYKCKKKFIKEEGCNKMTCSCGAKMCYLCKTPVTSYDHFSESDPKKCPLWSDSLVLHAEEVKKTAVEVKEKLLAEQPHVQLKHDPTKDLPEVPTNRKRKHDDRIQRMQDWELRFAEMQRFYAQGQYALPFNMFIENNLNAGGNLRQFFRERHARRRARHH